jgi:hypothetical protein
MKKSHTHHSSEAHISCPVGMSVPLVARRLRFRQIHQPGLHTASCREARVGGSQAWMLTQVLGFKARGPASPLPGSPAVPTPPHPCCATGLNISGRRISGSLTLHFDRGEEWVSKRLALACAGHVLSGTSCQVELGKLELPTIWFIPENIHPLSTFLILLIVLGSHLPRSQSLWI